MVAEVFASLSGFKAMYDMAKALKDIDDAVRRNAAVLELQEKILAAREDQAMSLGRISELEKEVATLKAWGAEKENYELKSVYVGAFAYLPKPNTPNATPAHWLCATCYENGKKSLLQDNGRAQENQRISLYSCSRPECGSSIRVPWDVNPDKPHQAPA
jgi:hypothetical protein